VEAETRYSLTSPSPKFTRSNYRAIACSDFVEIAVIHAIKPGKIQPQSANAPTLSVAAAGPSGKHGKSCTQSSVRNFSRPEKLEQDEKEGR
jgi:hypothetical protein